MSKNSGPPYLCSMSEVYAHLAAEHLAPYAERLCAGRAVAADRDGTFTHKPEKLRACIAASP